ncbi:hypothetical protein TRVL_05248 [Trypanosoma vivax]|nr:hypothetical protein TRVL_05248 [Trypanosoma vivax]
MSLEGLWSLSTPTNVVQIGKDQAQADEKGSSTALKTLRNAYAKLGEMTAVPRQALDECESEKLKKPRNALTKGNKDALYFATDSAFEMKGRQGEVNETAIVAEAMRACQMTTPKNTLRRTVAATTDTRHSKRSGKDTERTST